MMYPNPPYEGAAACALRTVFIGVPTGGSGAMSRIVTSAELSTSLSALRCESLDGSETSAFSAWVKASSGTGNTVLSVNDLL
jgi:hypothetical protein